MRYLAEIEGKQPAEAFVAYLITQSIATHIEASPRRADVWEIWIRDEDALPQARQAYEAFAAQPNAPMYVDAVASARQIIKEKQQASQAASKQIRRVEYSGSAASTASLTSGRLPPLTLTLMLLCIAVSLLSNFYHPHPNSKLGVQIVEKLSFVSHKQYTISSGDPAADLKRGEYWRIFTPIFLHGDPLHLAMNMLALVTLGRVAERLLGTSRFGVIVLALAAMPMMLACLTPVGSPLGGSPFTIGISGVIYGLASYLWITAQLRPELGFRVPDAMIGFLLLVVVLGFAGVIEGLSNWAHLGGFVVGLALAALPLLSRGRRGR